MHTTDASFSATTLLRYEGPKDLAAFAPATFVPSLQGCRGGGGKDGSDGRSTLELFEMMDA